MTSKRTVQRKVTAEAGTPPGPERPARQRVGRKDPVGSEFGDRVRGLRERAGMTLEQLSTLSGVSRAMLSKVERGEKSPTIGVAKRIAQSVDASLSALIGGENPRRAVVLVREAERHVFRDPETGFERHLLSPAIAGCAVEVLYHRLPGRASTGELPAYPSGTEKHVVVSKGELVVVLPDVEMALREGDALFFEADVEHLFENRTARACGYYLVISRTAKT